ncbi:MAG: carboxypeptidase regulatory-like domain-containing protein [Deltaproteobacteria bacterium]|nr:carboxypeptidase regulatory-like domain-containing protein [Deltaproteobacteria bacterium]
MTGIKALIGASAVVICALACFGTACQTPAIPFDADDVAGTVTSTKGAEAGVWVIAETTDLPTKFVRIVVTDDRGRYLIPDLPDASYKLWVRGYGLVDSDPVETTPGGTVDLTAALAPDPLAAAQYYPANYWHSMLRPPATSEFPGTGPEGNGLPTDMLTQQTWLTYMKENCLVCHQVGNAATREVPNRAKHASALMAWQERVLTKGIPTMVNYSALFGTDDNGVNKGLEMFAEWSERIAAGETPRQAPPRPVGVERNAVITLWDWAVDADGKPQFVHDEISTDKRDPTLNANGPVFGSGQFAGKAVWLDPNTHTTGEARLPTAATLAYYGEGRPAVGVPEGSAQPHNPMLDQDGRLWQTTVNRDQEQQPDWCTDGAKNRYARFFPLDKPIGRPAQLSVFDYETKKTRLVDTCFGTHHLEFGFDEDDTLYLSGDVRAMGWVNTRVFDETGSAEKSVGWCPNIIDTNGDGKIGEIGNPMAAPDPTKDTLILGFLYGLGINPVDDSAWYVRYTQGPRPFHVPGGILRMERGQSPPETCAVEYYEPPMDANGVASAFNPRGVDLDTKGVAWVAFGSGHLGRFDRTRCEVFKGPSVTGQQCKEGWTVFEIPAPGYEGVDARTTNSSWNYLIWVDQHDVFGLGKDVPIVPGTQSDSLIAFLPDEQKFIELRVPYPMGSYFRGLDGRIDDIDGGWKGRGLWANYGSYPISHAEGANYQDQPGKVVKIQLRPDPLAR